MKLKPQYIVLRRVNGHAEPPGQAIQLYDTAEEAEKVAVELALKFRDNKFCVAQIYTQFCVEARVIQDHIGEGEQTAA